MHLTSSKLLNSHTWVHSSSINIKWASLHHFLAFDSFMLSWITNRLTCYKKKKLLALQAINEHLHTSRLDSALVNMTKVEPQHTFISSNNWSGLILFSSWIDLNNAFRCADGWALTHIAQTRPALSQSTEVRSGISLYAHLHHLQRNI